MKKQPTINPNDFVSVESGSEDVYVPLNEEIDVYDVDKAIDEVNGVVVAGSTEDKIDYLDETKTDIREAIINKGVEVGEDDPFRSYAEKIGEIEGGEVHNQDKNITENGTYTYDEGYTGLGEVEVDVNPPLQDKTITTNGTYTADSGYYGLDEVTVDIDTVNNQDKTITENGTYTADSGYTGLGTVIVNTPVVNNEDKTIRVNGTYTAGAGYTGLGEVVVDVADIPAVVEPLSVSPTTSQQIITPPANVDGFNQVTVSAVTSSIDANISAGNIKSGVSILGVQGNVVELDGETTTVSPTTSQQVITPTGQHNGLTEVTIEAVDASIDSDIVAGNIKSGVNILGVSGSVVELNADSLSVTPTTSAQTITPTSPYNAFNEVSVGAVTSSIDSNISAGNIKSGVSILGVAGSVEELHGLSLTVTPSTSDQWIQPQGDYNAFDDVFVNAVDSTIDSNIQAGNIKSGVSILGVNGSVVELNGAETTVAANTFDTTYYPLAPKNGFTKVTVSAVTSAIDSNIQAGNIKDGVTILGVQGTYTGGGITPTGTMTITNNGIYDITNYANVDVDVPTTLPTYMREYKVSSFGKLEADTTTNHIMSFDGVPDIGEYVMAFAYTFNNVISGVIEMKDLVRLTGTSACEGMCQGCHNITGVNLPELVEVSGDRGFKNAFFACRGLTSVNIPKLKDVTRSNACQYMFAGEGNFNYYNISSIDISSLETVTGWYGCEGMFSHTGLVNVDFYSLRVVSGYQAIRGMLASCIYLTTVKFWALQPDGFGSYTNQFNVLLSGCSGVTVHFPSNLQSVIGSWSDVQNGFNGTNTTVLFDLPATVELVGTNSYRRNPKYDTATALGWYDTSATMATPYYTSGTTDPVVNDAIYSDASCTTQVDTIASIS